MNDTPTNGQGHEEQAQLPPFTINFHYLKDLSFENPNAPMSLVGNKPSPQVDLSINTAAKRLDENGYEVSLTISATAKFGEEVGFVVETTYGGVFTLGAVPEEHIGPLLLIDGPTFLFPFARATIADATREGGFPPLNIQPINFVEFYRRQIEAAQAEAAQAPANA